MTHPVYFLLTPSRRVPEPHRALVKCFFSNFLSKVDFISLGKIASRHSLHSEAVYLTQFGLELYYPACTIPEMLEQVASDNRIVCNPSLLHFCLFSFLVPFFSWDS